MTLVIVFQLLSVAISAVSCTPGQSKGALEESLKYWETVSMSNIKRRIVKRDTKSQHPVEQLITFDSYGRQFSLFLRKDFSVLAPGFKILVFEADGKSRELHLDLNLYRGIVEGEAKSFVSAYLNGNRALSASIQTTDEFYFVEPAMNLVPNAANDTMIIYRESDLRWNNNSRCGYVNDDGLELESVTEQLPMNETETSRSKRSTCRNTEKNTCHLYLVADPKFVANVGNNDMTETASRMLSVIDQVDQIYREHQFDECDAGFGFEVKMLHIFPQVTKGYPYTSDTRYGYSEFLATFSQDTAMRDVCLGHIFTYQSFYDKGYVLGLAYTGSPIPYKIGGICSIEPMHKNAGWTSYLGIHRVPTLQAMLITVHELGHNWGSPHDSDISVSCNPPASNGGKYIMYPMSVAGRDRNNFIFSPCSRTSIGLVLNAKATCFIEKKVAFCGNYRVDQGEECDSGFIVTSDGDKCCDSQCKLRRGAQCSDLNNLCCKNCQMVSADDDFTCFRTSDDICVMDTKCNGRSANCPPSEPKPNGTQCFNKGQCKNGVCRTLCDIHGFETCSCDTEQDACKRCCVNAKGSCFPLFTKGGYDNLPAGMACVSGTCSDKGVCIKSTRNLVARLWEILDLTSPSAFVRFMQNNIVWTVVIISLILWVPICCCICYMDRKAKKERDVLIREVIHEMMDEEESVSSAASLPPSPQPVERLELPVQHEMTDEQKPGSPATFPSSPQPVERLASGQETTDEQKSDLSEASPPSSPQPMGRLALRRETQKEEIRQAVQRLSLNLDAPEHSATFGKVWSWLKIAPDSAKTQ